MTFLLSFVKLSVCNRLEIQNKTKQIKPSFTTENLGSAALDNSGQNPGQEPRDRRQVLPAVRTGEERVGGGPEEGRGV